jgi:hypothetical protein
MIANLAISQNWAKQKKVKKTTPTWYKNYLKNAWVFGWLWLHMYMFS